MRRVVVLLAVAACGVAVAAQPPPSGAPPAAAHFPLTVDSIMRGPALVGYPPSDLRWSGDSQDLYFEWRMPSEDEPATWVASREGGQPRRGSFLTEVSPDNSTLGVIFSSATRPPEVFVMPNKAGAQARQLTTSSSADWRSYKWVEPRLVTYKARDGASACTVAAMAGSSR